MKLSFAPIAVLACAAAASAQTDRLYMPSSFSSSGTIAIVQGGSATNFGMAGSSQEGTIAVYGDVRTTGSSQGYGAKYDLNGSYLGTTYSQFYGYSMYDGTTDGTYNYACNWASDQVIRFDRDWSNPTTLFSTGQSGMFGITYDTASGTLWTTNRFNGLAQNWKMDGTPISSFSAPNIDGIAYEPSTGTLWFNQQGGNALWQYSTSGSPMQLIFVSGLSAGYAGGYAIEFDTGIPAPGSLALLGLGGLAAARRRR